MTTLSSRILRYTRGSGESILIWIVTGPIQSPLTTRMGIAYSYHDFYCSQNNTHLVCPMNEIEDLTCVSVSYLDSFLNLYLNGRLSTTIYDKCDGFYLQWSIFFFHVVIHHIHMLIVCITKLIQYAAICLQARIIQSMVDY
jgi:hypothetical protein